mmetsp:Transcript_129302/g.253230  ORF Transcript_129302/g.253230 Transcript_129302/m.253230 type:complete len:481 (+) Transcript_129302:55-1497(+)
MKRGNVNGQMSREDVEALDENNSENSENEGMGTFKRASAEVLAARRIVKTKRGGSTSTSAASALGASVAQELKPAAIANPFMFGGSGAPVMPVRPTVPVVEESEQSKKIRKLNESFFKWASKQIETHPLSIWKDGVQDYINHYKSIEEKYSGSSQSKATPSALKSSPSPATTGAPKPDLPFGAAPASSEGSKPFAGFSFAPSASAPPVAASAATTAAAPAAKASPFAGFSFAAAAAPAAAPVAPPATITAAPASAPFGSGFGDVSKSMTSNAPPSSFSSKFSFGSAAPVPAPAPSSSSFGGFGSGATVGFGGFGGFGATSTSAPAADGGVAEANEEGGDDEGEPILEPEKVLRNENDTDEILHEVPCKLYSFNSADKEWKDTGKGTFRITRDATSKKQRMLVRNQVGRINFNAGFYKTMKIEKVQKRLKFAAFVAVEEPSPNSEGKTTVRTEMKNFMIQLKPEDLDATQKKLEAAVESCA